MDDTRETTESLQENKGLPPWLQSRAKASILTELADILDLSNVNIRPATARAVEVPADINSRVQEAHQLAIAAMNNGQLDADYYVAIAGLLLLIRNFRDHNTEDFETAFTLFHYRISKAGMYQLDLIDPCWQILHIYLSWIRKDVVGASGDRMQLPPYVSESQPGLQRADIFPMDDFPEVQSIMHPSFPTNSDDPARLCMMGTALTRRFELLLDPTDIDNAVQFGKRAISSSPPAATHSMHHHKLVTFLIVRYDHFKNSSDLHDAVQHFTRAFELVKGLIISECFRDSLELQAITVLARISSGRATDKTLDRQITILDEFLFSAIRPTGPAIPMIQAALSELYLSCFLEPEHTQGLSHLHRAIDHSTKLLTNLPIITADPVLHAKCLERLSTAYQLRFSHSASQSDWDLHTQHLERLVQLLETLRPPSQFMELDRGLSLAAGRRKLALALVQQFSYSQDPRDLDVAHKMHRSVVEGLSQESWHPHDHFFLASISLLNWKASGGQESLTDAHSRIVQSFKGIEDLIGKPKLPSSLLAHATHMYMEYTFTQNPATATSCIELCKEIANAPQAEPETKLRAASMWGQLAFTHSLPDCIEAFEIVSSLSSEVASLWLGNALEERFDKVTTLSSSISSMATSAAIAFKDNVEMAVEFYEQGLSLNYRQLLQLRSEMHELEREHPSLAQQLMGVTTKLKDTKEKFPALGMAESSDAKIELAAEYKQLLAEIRTKRGFEKLFLPLEYQELASAAAEGPVILISHAYDNFADAIIMIEPSRAPIALCLPGVTQANVNKNMQRLSFVLHRRHVLRGAQDDGTEGERGGKPSKPAVQKESIDAKNFEEILSWLWEAIVNPVFEVLQECGVTSAHIWWCVSSIFTRFPLHAAAPLDCPYIQSYTTTLESLIKARAALDSRSSTDRATQMTVVGVSQYESWSSLACVSEEVEIISDLVGNQATTSLSLMRIENERATTERVLEVIKSSQILHLACHGKQDRDHPLESGLLLTGGTLTLKEILDEELQLAELVVLSACQTATGDEKLMDEAIHLAGGFMAAGFKGAIGTLWSIHDPDGPVVARLVYETMMKDGKIDIRKAAESLKNAVKFLREKGVAHERWIPFVHVGV